MFLIETNYKKVIYNDGKIEKMSVEKAAPKKKKKATLTEQQKINEMLEDFEFPF